MIRILLILFSFTLSAQDIMTDASLGLKPQFKTVHKFGYNGTIGTTLTPVTSSGFYRTPQTAVTLSAISTSVNDTLLGSSAQQITLVYLDSNFDEQTDIIDMNGTTESTDTITGVMRLLRAYVSRSGTYANQTTPSQDGTITIRVSGAGDVWGNINKVNGLGLGQSQIGAYTVRSGHTVFILSTNISVDGSKSASCYLFSRDKAGETSANYTGVMRLKNSYIGVSGQYTFHHKTLEKYEEKTDIGYLCETTSGTTAVSVEFEMLEVSNTWLDNNTF